MTNHAARARTRLATVLAAVALVSAGACARHDAAPRPATLAEQVASLQRADGLLQSQLELAAGKDFYLVLDPAASTLTLMLNGAELRRFSVLGLKVGEPRVSWLARPDRRPWQDVVWSHGELVPPRQMDRYVVEAGPPVKNGAEPETPPVPPTPEEMYPVPPRYQVRFDEGRSIEIRPLDADQGAGRLARLRAWWSAKWHDAVEAAFHREQDGVRLRVVLGPKEAASFYRSLPPAVHLVILPADRQPATPAHVLPK
jgi:hypothetical protein